MQQQTTLAKPGFHNTLNKNFVIQVIAIVKRHTTLSQVPHTESIGNVKDWFPS